MSNAGILALAVKYPSILRTNDFWRNNYPEMIEQVAQKGAGKVWSGPKDPRGPSALFDTAMAPYLDDPFRGTVERRVLSPSETSLGMELEAAHLALEAAKMAPGDLDVLISVGFVPTGIAVGNGAYLANLMGLKCPAFNLETACSGALIGLQTVCGLVQAGHYRNAMVTVSCTYSMQCEPSNPLSLTSGDGAAAFIVGPVPEGHGHLGGKSISTGITCGAMYYTILMDGLGGTARVHLNANPRAGKLLRESALSFIEECTSGALHKAGVKLRDIDFFVFNTPTAWYIDFCTKALGIDPAKTIDTYPLYANTGPALTTGNLYHALADEKIRPGDLVMVYSVGSVSTASAAVFRWTETALGPKPEPPATVE